MLLARRLGDQSALALAYDRIVTLDPFGSATHSAYGRLALERRDVPLVVREFRAAIAAGPVDPVPARCDLAEALLATGEHAEAKQAVLAALEIAPTYERAQQLLLRIVEGREVGGEGREAGGSSLDVQARPAPSPWSREGVLPD